MRPRPRRLTRRQRAERTVIGLQLALLDEVARGLRPPSCPREEGWLYFRATGQAVDPMEFVLPRVLWLLERMQLEMAADDPAPTADGQPPPLQPGG